MNRIESLADVLKAVKKYAGDAVELLGPEIMSYDMLSADVQKQRELLKEVQNERTVVKIEIEKAKETAVSIVDTAKEESARIIENGKNVMIKRMEEGIILLDAIKEFVGDADKKRYMKLREQAEKVAA